MPWKVTDTVKERLRFVQDFESGQWEMAELCEHYGVSRPTGYKWRARYAEEGEAGLLERSHRPRRCPHETTAKMVELVLDAKLKYRWGARKLRRVLERNYPRLELPARSTIFDILERHGLVRKKRRRRKWNHPGAVPLRTTAPNQVWTADFKGQFPTRNAVYCYPLTIADHFSRYLYTPGQPLQRAAKAILGSSQGGAQHNAHNNNHIDATGIWGCAMASWPCGD